MSTETTTRFRHGFRHGDISYITLGLPDLSRGRAFYGTGVCCIERRVPA